MKRCSWLLLLFIWLFLFVEYALRVSDSVLIPTLANAFHHQAFAISILSSSYYFTYVFMQIPAGLMVDRAGLRTALSFACGLLGCGTILMGMSGNIYIAIIARIMMGFGSSFAFIGSIKVLRQQFRVQMTSLWIGITMTIATLGAACGQEPWHQYVSFVGSWRYAYDLAGLLVITTALLIFWFAPEVVDFAAMKQDAFMSFTSIFRLFFKKIQFWLLGCYVALLSAPITAFIAFWAIPFLTQGRNFTITQAASVTSISWIGGLLGGPVLGFIADYFNCRKLMLLLIGFAAATTMLIVLYQPLSMMKLTIALFVLGFLCNGNVIVFAIITDSLPSKFTGFVTGVTNMFNMGGGPIFQVFIGVMLSLFGVDLTKANQDYLFHFQHALVIIPIGLGFLTLLLSTLKLNGSQHELNH